MITETFDYDGGRQVSVHVPPDPVEAVVFCGDGQVIVPCGDRLVAAGLRSTMIIGAHRTTGDEMIRIGEYSPTIEPERFLRHEHFFLNQVRGWARTALGIELPAERTAVAGVSASAELALALGVRHPTVFGAVLAASPGGGYRPPSTWPETLPRTYLTAGDREPFFADNAQRWADALRDADAEVTMTVRAGDHGDPFWAEEFPRMVAWAFRAHNDVS
ncbi:enterochelin esterase-like enzyme [Friedmanniella endophytica]|uniref:Enterochelin esterase-like enzyme n=1 Tax=Microlunatus kandeliicorticis TaxID=1759536 RepID=A0A7W3IT30_9ACTN|nr:alpha/beta hydrolase-fold protein [Microlunatus kandeliicorticis]MBA8794753.1 enterochelin esterase-like enzyme [Microlunatus kandeliicorticis]